jgi:hypothetical protein
MAKIQLNFNFQTNGLFNSQPESNTQPIRINSTNENVNVYTEENNKIKISIVLDKQLIP